MKFVKPKDNCSAKRREYTAILKNCTSALRSAFFWNQPNSFILRFNSINPKRQNKTGRQDLKKREKTWKKQDTKYNARKCLIICSLQKNPIYHKEQIVFKDRCWLVKQQLLRLY